MSGIDWERYAKLCEESYTPAVERFANSLRAATSVATKLSTPVFAGALKANLVTVLRTMTGILKQVSESQLSGEKQRKIRWRDVENRMRELWFDRLSGIDNLPIAQDYIHTRIQNRPSDLNGLYEWICSLHNKESEIDVLERRILEETALFTRRDVPDLMELAQLGIRLSR